jgi:fimbrial chaperone protein
VRPAMRRAFSALAGTLGLLFAPFPASAGSFEIVPIPLVLEAGAKIAVLNVTNNGDEKVTIQGEAMEWTQDENGLDRYAPAKEIVFFPRIFTLEKGEEKAVRVGYQGEPARTREKTYRLVLRELPAPRSVEHVIRMALTLSVPVFVKPPTEVLDSAIEKAWVAEGTLWVKVRNQGNTHVLVKRIKATGLSPSKAEVFSKDFRGWYVLAGASSTFFTEIAGEQCRASRTLKVGMAAEHATSESTLALSASDCARPATDGR